MTNAITLATEALSQDEVLGANYTNRVSVSCLAISLMARDAAVYEPLGSGAALTAIDRLASQSHGYVVRSSLRAILKYAPQIAEDAAEIFLLRRAS